MAIGKEVIDELMMIKREIRGLVGKHTYLHWSVFNGVFDGDKLVQILSAGKLVNGEHRSLQVCIMDGLIATHQHLISACVAVMINAEFNRVKKG
jgi:hypothetical protein